MVTWSSFYFVTTGRAQDKKTVRMANTAKAMRLVARATRRGIVLPL